MPQLTNLERYIKQKIATGEFPSKEQFFLAAVALYREMEFQHLTLSEEVGRRLHQAESGAAKELDYDALEQRVVDRLANEGVMD